jgi:hypothetical protein
MKKTPKQKAKEIEKELKENPNIYELIINTVSSLRSWSKKRTINIKMVIKRLKKMDSWRN